MAQELNQYQIYFKDNIDSFRLLDFYKHFKFGIRSVAEDIFKKSVGSLKRCKDKELKLWADGVCDEGFEVLNRLDVVEYWNELKVALSRSKAKASGADSLYAELAIDFQTANPTRKRKNSESSEIQDTKQIKLGVRPPKKDNDDLSTNFKRLQEISVKHINETKGGLPLELSLYEMMSTQNVLLLKPKQNSEVMLNIFGAKELHDLHATQTNTIIDDHCPQFLKKERKTIQKIIEQYQNKEISLKMANSKLMNVTLDMSNVESAVVNSIRRLIEKLPQRPLQEPMKSETELWSSYIDPILDPMISCPEEGIHLRWTNRKEVDHEAERPDGVVSSITESKWGHSIGHGEVKIAEPTDNFHLLAWDLCRLAHFNKHSINHHNFQSCFAFQVKGHSITFYVTELVKDGIYFMTEFEQIDIPKSVESLDNLVTKRNLNRLLHVAYVVEKVKSQKQQVTKEFFAFKRDGPSLSKLAELVSDTRDKTRPCTLRF